MKKIFFLLIAFFTIQSSFAQDFPFFDLGIKGGANAAYFTNLSSGTQNDGHKIGFVAGVFARIKVPLIGLFVQPEAVVSQIGGKTKATVLGVVVSSETTVTNLDFPILIGQRFGIGPLALRFNVGPVFSNVLSAKTGDIDIKDQVNSFQTSLQAGVGLDISKINIDLRYQHGFTNLTKNGSDVKISAFQATIGIKLL